MTRRGGLGRGLDALIPAPPRSSEPAEPDRPGAAGAPGAQGGPERADALTTTPADQGRPAGQDAIAPAAAATSPSAAVVGELEIERIDANPRQPRSVFDEEALDELAASIGAVGVLQPVVVRPSGDRFELVMGERRVRAARIAGLVSVPAVVRVVADDDLLRDALIENVHREDLNPLEEAAAYEQLLADFGLTHEELAERLGRSRPAISNALRILRLPVSVQRRIAAGTLSAGHARAVASLSDPGDQETLADRIVAEGLTVRMAEELARRVALGEPLRRGVAAVRRPALHAPGADALAERLSELLDTRVLVQLGKRKGKVLIEFASLEDLQRICDTLGVGVEAPDP